MIQLVIADAKDGDGNWILFPRFLEALLLQGYSAKEFELIPYQIPEKVQQKILAYIIEDWPSNFLLQLGRYAIRLKQEAEVARTATGAAYGASSLPIIECGGPGLDLGVAVITEPHQRVFFGSFPTLQEIPGQSELRVIPKLGTSSTHHRDDIEKQGSNQTDYIELKDLSEDVTVNAVRCALEALQPRTPAISRVSR